MILSLGLLKFDVGCVGNAVLIWNLMVFAGLIWNRLWLPFLTIYYALKVLKIDRVHIKILSTYFWMLQLSPYMMKSAPRRLCRLKISEVGVLISQLRGSFLEACFCHQIQVLLHSICNIFGIDLIAYQSFWNIKYSFNYH
jgi:hypothetical protein